MKKNTAPAPDAAGRRLQLGVLRDNLGYLSRVLRNVTQQSSSRHVDDLGHATGQITMLGLIAANDGVSQGELAGAMLMRKSQVTGLIQDLVERGLVAREQGGDRRYSALSLTAPGQQAWKRARERIRGHSDELLGALDEAERTQLTALIRKLLAAQLRDVDIDFER